MTVTRANIESVLIRRVGRLLTAAGLDGTTINGTNADLNDPISSALRVLNYTVSSIASVTDTDLLPVTDAHINYLLDVAELRTLESILGNLDLVDIRVGPRSESLSQLADQVQKAIERKTRHITRMYGVGLGGLVAGKIALSFQQDADEELGA